MIVNNFLHLYLNRSPSQQEIKALLKTYGFRFQTKDKRMDPHEPEGYHWTWYNPPLSDEGFKLVFYHRLFSDDKLYGKYNSFAILAGDKRSSDMDMKALDIFSHLLLDKYGGRLYNPEGKDQSGYLCGSIRSKAPTR